MRQNEFSDQTKKSAVKRQRGRCGFCGIAVRTPYSSGAVIGHLHHLKPILHGGSAEVDNAVYLCESHHLLLGHGIAALGVDAQGGSFRTRVVLSKRDFPYWSC